jgi:hypothetical protein
VVWRSTQGLVSNAHRFECSSSRGSCSHKHETRRNAAALLIACVALGVREVRDDRLRGDIEAVLISRSSENSGGAEMGLSKQEFD